MTSVWVVMTGAAWIDEECLECVCASEDGAIQASNEFRNGHEKDTPSRYGALHSWTDHGSYVCVRVFNVRP